MENIEEEVTKLIQEVEENKKRHEELILTNEKLKIENEVLKSDVLKYSSVYEENVRLKRDMEERKHSGLSEEDLADVMINAKVVAKEMIRSAENKALEFEKQQQETLRNIYSEGQTLKEEILKIKSKVDRDLYQWVEDLETLLQEQENKISEE